MILTGKTLLVATHNQGKLEEISQLLSDHGVRVVSAGALGLSVPEETESTFAGNAGIKARAGLAASGLPTLADDSGLTVDALGGAPGVHTADWAEVAGGRDFRHAMHRLWSEIVASGAPEPWRAQFRCTLVLALPDSTEQVFEGVMPGQIVWPMRGTFGHGYDPLFQPDGYNQTFGEMDRWEKNRISHRSDAFRKLVARCFT